VPVIRVRGTDLHYEDTGGSGEPVLSLHGFLFDGRQYEPPDHLAGLSMGGFGGRRVGGGVREGGSRQPEVVRSIARRGARSAGNVAATMINVTKGAGGAVLPGPS
jgi:hypothetical protein